MAFSTSQLVLIALFGALMFVFDMLVVSGVDAATGIPGSGVLVDTVFIITLAVVCGLAVPKFGTFTLGVAVYSFLASPTSLLGPPGIYKLVFVFLGLIADVIVWLFNYRRMSYYIALAIANALMLPVLFFTLTWLGLPGAEELGSALWFFLLITTVECLIGSWVGIKLFDKKISKMRVMQRFFHV